MPGPWSADKAWLANEASRRLADFERRADEAMTADPLCQAELQDLADEAAMFIRGYQQATTARYSQLFTELDLCLIEAGQQG